MQNRVDLCKIFENIYSITIRNWDCWICTVRRFTALGKLMLILKGLLYEGTEDVKQISDIMI